MIVTSLGPIHGVRIGLSVIFISTGVTCLCLIKRNQKRSTTIATLILALASMISGMSNREPQRQCFFYNCTARYGVLSSQRAAALPCLTQRVEKLGVFQVLYCLSIVKKKRPKYSKKTPDINITHPKVIL